MIRFVRILGGVLMALGAIVVLSWFIKPLRKIWPIAFEQFRSLPGSIQFGLIVAAVGFVLLCSSLIWERFEDSKAEGSLLDDDPNQDEEPL